MSKKDGDEKAASIDWMAMRAWIAPAWNFTVKVPIGSRPTAGGQYAPLAPNG
jgi:hypothetical protein